MLLLQKPVPRERCIITKQRLDHLKRSIFTLTGYNILSSCVEKRTGTVLSDLNPINPLKQYSRVLLAALHPSSDLSMASPNRSLTADNR